MAKQKLRVWNIINPPNKGKFYDVDSPDDAVKLINQLANQQLQDPEVVANAFGLEAFEYGEWSEWYSEDGSMDIREYEESLLESK